MRFNYNTIKKIRSGQTVWRILVRYDYNNEFTASVTPTCPTGKRVLYHFMAHADPKKISWSSMKIVNNPRNPIEARRFYYRDSWFLNDLLGTACFSSRRQAERFVQEVKDGLHPKVIEDALDRKRWNDELDRWSRDEYYDNRDDAFEDYDGPDNDVPTNTLDHEKAHTGVNEDFED